MPKFSWYHWDGGVEIRHRDADVVERPSPERRGQYWTGVDWLGTHNAKVT